MTNFLTHLRDAVIEKKLFPNKSKTGNWLSLLNHQQLEELTSLIESLPNDRDSVEQLSLLVFSLCGLEGINLHEHYKDDLVQAVKEFSLMGLFAQIPEKFFRTKHLLFGLLPNTQKSIVEANV